MLKERSTFEIMDATEVGFDSNQIVLGKHSGRHALRDALEHLGFVVEGEALNRAFARFKEVADRKKQVTALDLEALVSDEMRREGDSHELASFEVTSGSDREAAATVSISLPDGGVATATANGDGPVDAIFQAVRDATGIESELREYRVAAVTGGEDALGQVTVVLRSEGVTASGQGVSTDILEASAQAYVRALANLVAEVEAALESSPDREGSSTKGP